jgi:hypothetical protein
LAKLDARRHPVLTGVVMGLMLGAFGGFAVSALSPTRIESAVVTGNGISDPPGRPARYYVTGSTESGSSFRLNGRALYELMERSEGDVPADVEVARWTGRVEIVRAAGLSSEDDRSWRGWWMAIAALLIAIAMARTVVRVGDRGSAFRIGIAGVVAATAVLLLVPVLYVR